MKYTRELQQAITRKVITIYLISLPLIMVFQDFIGMFIGLTLGAAFSLVSFHLLASTLEKAVTMPPGKAAAYTVSRYFIRYFLTAILIAISLKINFIDIKGTVAGLLLIKLIILVNNIVDSREILRKAIGKDRA